MMKKMICLGMAILVSFVFAANSFSGSKAGEKHAGSQASTKQSTDINRTERIVVTPAKSLDIPSRNSGSAGGGRKK